MSNFVVDVESDGPCPGMHSMHWFGAVLVTPELQHTFEGKMRPISDIYVPEALAVSKVTRDEILSWPEPKDTMQEFADWLKENNSGKRTLFWSDNNGYDFSFINYYFWTFLGHNPFGWTSQNINSFYKGIERDIYVSFKYLSRTKHDHHPVNDAMGMAEALLAIREKFAIKINFE